MSSEIVNFSSLPLFSTTHVTIRCHCFFQEWLHSQTTRFFDVVDFTIPTPLSLLPRCRLSFPISSLKISPLPNFALKSPNRIFVWYLGKLYKKNLLYFLMKTVFWIIIFSSLGACTFKTTTLYQRPLRTIHDILSVTNSTCLLLWCTKKKKNLFPIDYLHFLFHRKNYYLLLLQCPLCPT